MNWWYAGPGLAMVILAAVVLYTAIWWVVLDACKDKRVDPNTALLILLGWIALNLMALLYGGLALMDAGGLIQMGK
ncbi:hypothetical protein GIKK_73 [Gordonia phage GiKK]|nr:hypothetical protein GIKK_73 [Gordonia phage GiKK]WKW84864.1 hypothetical protein SEA_JAMZY_73 [Gordonia phage Jamzy]